MENSSAVPVRLIIMKLSFDNAFKQAILVTIVSINSIFPLCSFIHYATGYVGPCFNLVFVAIEINIFI
jgi:hypothetical protein